MAGDENLPDRVRWHNTCMIRLRYEKAYSPRFQGEEFKIPCSKCDNKAHYRIIGSNILYHYINNPIFCSPECLQRAILEMIFTHNLTDKRFLSLITTNEGE